MTLSTCWMFQHIQKLYRDSLSSCHGPISTNIFSSLFKIDDIFCCHSIAGNQNTAHLCTNNAAWLLCNVQKLVVGILSSIMYINVSHMMQCVSGEFLPEASIGLWVLLPASVCVYVCQSVCQSLACLCNNSGPVQVRITKSGPKVQNNLVKVPNVLWSNHFFLHSRSNLTLRSKFTPFWACLHHISSLIQARITKFGL